MKTPNLNKIKLYCILNNIKSGKDLPRCADCKRVRTSCFLFKKDKILTREEWPIYDNLRYSVSKDFKVFQLGHSHELVYYGHCCNDWKKR